MVSFNETEELLKPLISIQSLKNYRGKDEKDKIGYLRAVAINELVNQLAKVFLNEKRIVKWKV